MCKLALITLMAVAIAFAWNAIKVKRWQKLPCLADEPAFGKYKIIHLTSMQIRSLWRNDEDNTILIVASDYLSGGYKYWKLSESGAILEQGDVDPQNTFSGLLQPLSDSWLSENGLLYGLSDPYRPVKKTGQARTALEYRGLPSIALNPTGRRSGSYWGAIVKLRLKHGAAELSFKEHAAIPSLFGLSAYPDINVYNPYKQDTQTEPALLIIELTGLYLNMNYAEAGRSYPQDRPPDNRGIYIVVENTEE